jgi:16S rRNA (cytosine967-C5)-methyltransferase
MIAPARQAAYEVLRAVNSARADLPNALSRVRARLADERDRALAGEIATGTLRWQAAFDHVVEQFARRPAAKLDPEVLDVLRLTIFQLLHLDRIPASAAVNDAVDLTRRAGKKSAAPLVNAVLRRVSRERDRLPLPTPPSLDYLAITLSHPRWLVERWVERYGFEAAEAWAKFDNSSAPLTLRANALRNSREELADKLSAAGIAVEPTPFAPHGLLVRSGNPLLAEKGGCLLLGEGGGSPLRPGDFLVQDEASQLVAVLANAQPGERVLDLCASPGGKTTAMAADMKNQGFIVACDVRDRRVRLLAQKVAESGTTIVRILQADASAPLPLQDGGCLLFGEKGGSPRFGRFGRVLLDAPCSGLGTLRRDPDIRWRRTEAELPALAAVQVAMLARAAEAVDPGGRVIYSTCSSEPDENEVVVDTFLGGHPDFRLATADELHPLTRRFLTPAGHFRTLPFRDRLEAFFAAMLVKTKDLR